MHRPVARRSRLSTLVASGLILGTLGFSALASADEIGPGDPKPAAAAPAQRVMHESRSTAHTSRASTGATHNSMPRMSRGGVPRNMPHVSTH
jgi:hypothetical protein